MSRNILESSLKNASFSIIFQILSRCVTFVLNAYIIRTVGHDVLGIMNVRLLLLESTILFLSKEPLLKACLTNTKSHNWAQVINQIWISVPVSSLLSILFVYIWLHMLSPVEEMYLNQYRIGCYCIAFSCILEQASQNVVLVAQSFCFVKLKLVLETLYIFTRTFTFVYLVQLNKQEAIGAFATAQVVSAVVLALSYYLFFAWYIPRLKIYNENAEKDNLKNSLFVDMTDFPFQSFWEFFPGKMPNEGKLLNEDLCLLSMSFAKQSVVKQVLTEGEKYVMTISPVMSFTEQSLYDIVNNLGSLAARFVFRPIEESAYFYFTQMIARNVPVKNQNDKSISEAALVLKQLCNVILSIGLIVFVFGQSYSYTLLYLYGGPKLAENVLATTLLKFHCFAIILLAVNGVTEGFVFSTMSNEQLDKYNYLLVVFSLMFLCISYVLTLIFGPVGFILANCANMLARIIHSLNFIYTIYKETQHRPIYGLWPSWKFVSILIISGYFTKISETFLVPTSIPSILIHILVGAVFLAITLLIWSYENKDLIVGYRKNQKMIHVKDN